MIEDILMLRNLWENNKNHRFHLLSSKDNSYIFDETLL